MSKQAVINQLNIVNDDIEDINNGAYLRYLLTIPPNQRASGDFDTKKDYIRKLEIQREKIRWNF